MHCVDIDFLVSTFVSYLLVFQTRIHCLIHPSLVLPRYQAIVIRVVCHIIVIYFCLIIFYVILYFQFLNSVHLHTPFLATITPHSHWCAVWLPHGRLLWVTSFWLGFSIRVRIVCWSPYRSLETASSVFSCSLSALEKRPKIIVKFPDQILNSNEFSMYRL